MKCTYAAHRRAVLINPERAPEPIESSSLKIEVKVVEWLRAQKYGQGCVGLENMGNTCYQNSLIQVCRGIMERGELGEIHFKFTGFKSVICPDSAFSASRASWSGCEEGLRARVQLLPPAPPWLPWWSTCGAPSRK